MLLNEERCGLYALQSSNKLAKYKIPEMLSRIYFLPPHYIMAKSLNKPVVFVWDMSQDASVQKYVLPGMALCLAASPCGLYLAAGIDNTIKFWHLPTGQLLNTVSNHYQKLETITWSHDGRHVVSGAHDNNVNVWEFHKVLNEESCSPLYSFANHSMPITDIHCGFGGFKSRLFTSGLDNICNIYELCSGKLMMSLEFPTPILRLLVSKCESFVYAVTVSTDVYKVSLVSEPDKDMSNVMKVFIRCPNKITSCCLTEDDNAIMIGTNGGDLLKYCSTTGQILPYSFKSRTQIYDMINITLPSYRRNDKPVPFPFPKTLQRTNTGLLSECSILLQPSYQPLTFASDTDFLSLVKEAVSEEEGPESVVELKQKVGELGALSDKLIQFATDQLIGS